MHLLGASRSAGRRHGSDIPRARIHSPSAKTGVSEPKEDRQHDHEERMGSQIGGERKIGIKKRCSTVFLEAGGRNCVRQPDVYGSLGGVEVAPASRPGTGFPIERAVAASGGPCISIAAAWTCLYLQKTEVRFGGRVVSGTEGGGVSHSGLVAAGRRQLCFAPSQSRPDMNHRARGQRRPWGVDAVDVGGCQSVISRR